MGNPYIIDRGLPERARLMFYFPIPAEGSPYAAIELPFFENPQISEKKRARFKKYSLISRSSQLYSYTGAESRKFSLKFNLTLPHLEEEHPGINMDRYISTMGDMSNVEEEKQRFLSPTSSPPTPKSPAYAAALRFLKLGNIRDSAKQVLGSPWARHGATLDEMSELVQTYDLHKEDWITTDVLKRGQRQVESQLDIELNAVNPYYSDYQDEAEAQARAELLGDALQHTAQRMRIIDMIIFWVNVVRSSVLNNAQDPVYGPPVVRLTHGLMYQDVPCICTDYNISWIESAGYDLKTLLPRKIEIQMNLEEMRSGNFGTFDRTQFKQKDNLAGWEAVILSDGHSLDPGEDYLNDPGGGW